MMSLFTRLPGAERRSKALALPRASQRLRAPRAALTVSLDRPTVQHPWITPPASGGTPEPTSFPHVSFYSCLSVG